jgi:hypothetical protein
MARILNARAVTVGRDIFFGRAQYSPQSNPGRRLLAHELSHVVQQENASTCILQCKPKFQDCDRYGAGTQEQDTITKAHDRAITLIGLAIYQLLVDPESVYAPLRWVFEFRDFKRDKIDTMIETYGKIRAGLMAEDFHYECDYEEDWNWLCEKGVYGWAAWFSDIHICWDFFSQEGKDDMAETIIHEAAHKWAGVKHGPDPLNNAYCYQDFPAQMLEYLKRSPGLSPLSL